MSISFQKIRLRIKNRQTHPAANIHSYGIRYYCMIRCQYTADGQTISGMCVRHQRSCQRYRESHGQFHLLLGRIFYKLVTVSLVHQRHFSQIINLKLPFYNGGREVFRQFPPYFILFICFGIIKHIC